MCLGRWVLLSHLPFFLIPVELLYLRSMTALSGAAAVDVPSALALFFFPGFLRDVETVLAKVLCGGECEGMFLGFCVHE